MYTQQEYILCTGTVFKIPVTRNENKTAKTQCLTACGPLYTRSILPSLYILACHKMFLSEIVSQNTKFGAKNQPFWGNLGARLKF